MAQHPARTTTSTREEHVADHSDVLRPVHNAIEAPVLSATAGQSIIKGSGSTFETYTAITQTSLDAATAPVITANRQTAAYTPVASDAGKVIEMNVAAAHDVTLPANVSTAGQYFEVLWYGTGQPTFVAGAGIGALKSADSKLKLRVRYSSAAIRYISPTEVHISGDLAT